MIIFMYVLSYMFCSWNSILLIILSKYRCLLGINYLDIKYFAMYC